MYEINLDNLDKVPLGDKMVLYIYLFFSFLIFDCSVKLLSLLRFFDFFLKISVRGTRALKS